MRKSWKSATKPATYDELTNKKYVDSIRIQPSTTHHNEFDFIMNDISKWKQKIK